MFYFLQARYDSCYSLLPVHGPSVLGKGERKPCFRHNSEIVYFLVVNNNNICYTLLTLSYSESAHPITPVEPLKAILYDYFGIWFILFTLYTYKQQ